MTKTDDKNLSKYDKALNAVADINNKGASLKTGTYLQVSYNVKINGYKSKIMAERRSANSDRRNNDINDYKGPARRMNIDRRK